MSDIHIDRAKQFIAMLTGSADTEVCWQTFWDDAGGRAAPADERKRRTACFHATLDAAFPRLAALQELGAGVYICVNDLEGAHRLAENVTKVRSFFIDVDGTRVVPERWPLEPTMVVQRDETHWHAYWLCNDASLDRFGDVQHQLAAYWGSDSTVCDLPRVMRVPGFHHLKDPSSPGELCIVQVRPRTYSEAEVVESHPVAAEKRYEPKTVLQTAEVVGASQRHNFLKTAAAKLRNVGLNGPEMMAAMRGIINSRFDLSDGREFADSELQDLIDWVMRREIGDDAVTIEDAAHGAAAADALRLFFDQQETELEEERNEDPERPGSFPSQLLNPGGLLGRWIDYVESQGFRRQPVLALASGLATLGAVMGRKVMSEMGARTNLYCVGVAPTGSGKECARSCAQSILHHAGMATDPDGGVLGPEDIASDAGLVSALSARPSSLLQIDEIGRMLRTLSNPAKAPHLYAIVTALLRFYTSAGGLFIGKAYADSKRNAEIHQPCCCVYGTTVPRSLYESLSPESLSDGFIARLLVFHGDDDPPRNVPIRSDPPDSVVNSVKEWRSNDCILGSYAPNPVVVRRTEGAQAVFDGMSGLVEEQRKRLGDSPLGDLWTRAEQKADQLSVIVGCSRHGRAGAVVDEESADYACRLSVYLTRQMAWQCSRHLSENDQERKSNRLLDIIRKAGLNGISTTSLTRKTRWLRASERRELLADLLISDVFVDSRATKGRPSEVWKIKGI